ncbi:hypothetical protein Pse7367_3545 [Thalassoporum mexicanum PCC 7367]|uniref:hypothetical protein n=1 Tax=Thalassoporum mexicanum TaxID=3457544 RepID=UPI00029FDA53|nr:hypothetical protein [Pseudanabaena sp. PCC 7367]AFY71780.1 hypothetical protein Pse7367_3545 [Pseudanabaena sp. PCC 7367]
MISESSIHSFNKWFKKNLALAISSGAGIAFILAGQNTGNQIYSAIGGAVFGASIGGIVARTDANETYESILELIKNSVESRLLSDTNEKNIQILRRKWHCYWVTKIDGEIVWKYGTVDFSNTLTPGKLHSKLQTYDKNNEPGEYLMQGVIYNDRTIFLGNSSYSTESCSFEIYPSMARSPKGSRHFGIGLYTSWDGRDGLFPVIMSPNMLTFSCIESHDIPQPGKTVSELYAQALDEIWRKGFSHIAPDGMDVSTWQRKNE